MRRFIVILLFFVIIVGNNGFCQENTDSLKLYRIETSDGNEYVGKIVGVDSLTFKFETSNIGVITIVRKDIVRISDLKQELLKDGSYWFENLQATRYFWAPNGFGLKEGEAYYQNMWVFYNQAGYGFSNYFSIGAGVVPLFLLGGAPTPVWITPKFSFPISKNKVNIGLGVLAATVVGEDDASFGIAYGVSTFGSRDKNLTIGMGYGYASGSWTKKPIIMASTMLRTGKKGYFMSENYLIPVGDEFAFIGMIGGRSLIKKVALDYGLVIPLFSDMEQLVAIPWLGFTIPIQSK